MYQKIIFSVMIILVVLSINSARSEDLLWQKDYKTHISSLEMSPDSKYLVVYSLHSHQVEILDMQNGESIQLLKDANFPQFTPDGLYLVTANGSIITYWELGTWIEFKQVDLNNDIAGITFSNNGQLLACESNYGVILFDTETWEISQKWVGFGKDKAGYKILIENVSFSYDNNKIAVTSMQTNVVHLYEVTKFSTTSDAVRIIKSADNAIFSPTRNEILVKKMNKEGASYYTEGLELYDLNTNIEPIFIYLSEEHYDKYAEFTTFSFSPDGNYIAISAVKGGDDNFQILNRNSLKKIFSKNYGKGGSSFPRIDKSNHYFACVDVCLNIENSRCLTIYEVSNYLEVSEDNNTKFEIYPNPSENNLNIQYYLDIHSEVKLLITDIKGNIIDKIINENQEPGNYNIDFRTDKLPSGTYFILFTRNGQKSTKQFVIVR